ncbi:conserved hypothetical protein [Methanosalsum zhilinae DSM 4017]|uniref:DUF7847 domain-containing protein n=1 Tax=Methanosalsum zhilinae (strain DSM 4017 / NBRC 107636 / OCM 62 / WeN5) TaxID=679901 RepID=F7XKX7_METZD|nr:hypothetical protein [Methanosalsum zhilinae]AEH60675.1 conserved hypothetical protein [Methanosalsum zhilinae DSM 4017]
MSISIEEVLNRGFSAWTKNLKISVPFILAALVVGIMWIAYMALFVIAVMPSLIVDPNMVVEALRPYLLPFGVGVLVIILISMLIEAFFTAGAIGMAKDVALNGRTSYEEMINSGKTHFFNYFLLQILFYLITLVGAIFVIPGILQIGDITNFDAIIQNLLVIGAGFVLWIIYGIFVSIILAVSYYALVVDKIGPIQAIKTSYRFFMNNKAAVVILWLLTVVVVIALSFIGMLFGFNETLAIIWSVISTIVSIVVIPAVFTLWWTFLYMGKTGHDVRDPKTIDTSKVSELQSNE